MNSTGILILAVILGVQVAPVSGAPETSSPTKAASAPTKDLVAAAKDAKTKRKKPSTTVLTNTDVKNAKGKLILLPAKEAEPAEETKQQETLSLLAQQDANYQQRLQLEAKLGAAQAKVDRLTRELEGVELRYYEENDPDRRDKLIRAQFELTKKELLEAGKELEALTPKAPDAAVKNP